MIHWKSCPFDDIKSPSLTHLFDDDSRWALKAALGARRPLLVRGEPGVGKSQLARAAARALGRPLVSQVITARTEAQDLLYRFDAVARLGQAQVLAVTRGDRSDGATLAELEERKFLQPGPLWWVFDWDDAEDQHSHICVLKGARPVPPDPSSGWSRERGTVLLIDEIDKADPDLPNALLESFGNGEFAVPHRDQPVRCRPDQEPPLVVITTNEERELPAAFVRRCLVLPISLPEGDELKRLLAARGNAHFGAALTAEVYEEAAEQLVSARGEQNDAPVKPGQAEYLDLLRALVEVAPGQPKGQLDLLNRIAGFALKKNAPFGA